jgi:hypothetical protein
MATYRFYQNALRAKISDFHKSKSLLFNINVAGISSLLANFSVFKDVYIECYLGNKMHLSQRITVKCRHIFHYLLHLLLTNGLKPNEGSKVGKC